VNAFEQNDLQPDWDTNWNGAVVRYKGSNGASATLTDTGTLVHFNLGQLSGSTTLYQRVHASNQVISSSYVPSWPAYNGTLTIGLDPAFQFWLDPSANDPTLVHITGLPSGDKLGLGTGTLVTPDFAYFKLLSVDSRTFDFFGNLWNANVGTTYNGVDGGLVNGATAFLTTMTVGGDSRQGIFAHPPYIGQQGGETFIEYSVPVPDGYAATLSFAGGILDSAIGLRQGPMTFRVKINGNVAWQQDISTGAWQAGNVDLTQYLNQTVTIRFVTNPGPANNSSYAWGGWSALQLSVTAKPALADAILAVPQSVTSSSISSPGGAVNVSNGTVSIANFPLGGTAVAFVSTPYPVTPGQSLMDIPFTKSQSSDGEIAGPSLVPYAGNIGPTSAGGVNKQRTIYGFTPLNGQFILSWSLQLPSTSALNLSFSTGLRDDAQPFNATQDVLLYVRVNGTVLWQYDAKLPSAWKYGVVDLSAWQGQKVLLELVSDSLGPNGADWTSWAELTLDGAASNNCATSLSSGNSIAAPAGGASGTINVTAASGCPWSAAAGSGWVNISPSSGTSNGSISYIISTNPGPLRQTTLAVAGHLITVNQDGAFVCNFSVSPLSQTFWSAGGTGNVGVNTPIGCSWSAQANANWLTVTLLGSTALSYSVAADPNGANRSGTITVAGQTVTVTQGAKKRKGQVTSN
jgi:Putative binding domain, N-terminal/Viral BACON domain